MRRAANPSGCVWCGAGAGFSAIKYQSLFCRAGHLGEDLVLESEVLRDDRGRQVPPYDPTVGLCLGK